MTAKERCGWRCTIGRCWWKAKAASSAVLVALGESDTGSFSLRVRPGDPGEKSGCLVKLPKQKARASRRRLSFLGGWEFLLFSPPPSFESANNSLNSSFSRLFRNGTYHTSSNRLASRRLSPILDPRPRSLQPTCPVFQ